MAIAARPPRRLISATASSSTIEMQSHSTLPSGVCDQQRPLADGEARLDAEGEHAGHRPSSRSRCAAASSSGVIQAWPSQRTYCRSSSRRAVFRRRFAAGRTGHRIGGRGNRSWCRDCSMLARKLRVARFQTRQASAGTCGRRRCRGSCRSNGCSPSASAVPG